LYFSGPKAGEFEPDEVAVDMFIGAPWSITLAGNEIDGCGEAEALGLSGEDGRRRLRGAERENKALCCVRGEFCAEDCARGVRSSSESSCMASIPSEPLLALPPFRLVAELLVSNQLGERGAASSFLNAGLRDRIGLALPLWPSNGRGVCGFGIEWARVIGGALSRAAPELRLRR
jgi:hypothetical protein